MELRGRHMQGYAPAGICLGCRHGWHSEARRRGEIPPECTGKRFKNLCPDYTDTTPTREEYKLIYAEELERIFEDAIELERLRAFGNARHHRAFLIDYIGIAEKELREIEDRQEGFRTPDGSRILKRIRWEL